MKYNFVYYIFFYIILFIIAWSCGTISTYEQDPMRKQTSSVIGKWKLQSVKSIGNSNLINIPSSQTSITLEINDEYRAYGYSGCNSFSGGVEIREDIIQFSSFISTSKGCPGKQNIEKVVLNALRNTNNYEVRGNILYLKYDKEVLAIYMATYEP